MNIDHKFNPKTLALSQFRHISPLIIYQCGQNDFGFRKMSLDPELGPQFEEYTVISRQQREDADGPRTMTEFDGSVEVDGIEYYCFRDI